MKKNYVAPEAEVVTFAKEDVITSSGFLFDWGRPPMDLGGKGDYAWDENGEVYRM